MTVFIKAREEGLCDLRLTVWPLGQSPWYGSSMIRPPSSKAMDLLGLVGWKQDGSQSSVKPN